MTSTAPSCHQVGRLNITEQDRRTQVQLPPTTRHIQHLWRQLRHHLTGTELPNALCIELDACFLELPDQRIALEHVHNIDTRGVLTLQVGDQLISVNSRLTPKEAHWLRKTLQLHVARRRAALSLLHSLR